MPIYISRGRFTSDAVKGMLAKPENRGLARYSASGVGLAAGGSIPNVLAVMQVIEKLPIEATSATRLSSPIDFAAAA